MSDDNLLWSDKEELPIEREGLKEIAIVCLLVIQSSQIHQRILLDGLVNQEAMHIQPQRRRDLPEEVLSLELFNLAYEGRLDIVYNSIS